MKRLAVLCCAILALIPAFGQTAKLSPAYSEAAIKALSEMDDTEFHAFHYARDVAAKTAADKHSAEQLEAFIKIHSMNVIVSKSGLADEKTRHDLQKDDDCAAQWRTNLRYRDAKVPAVCGLKF